MYFHLKYKQITKIREKKVHLVFSDIITGKMRKLNLI